MMKLLFFYFLILIWPCSGQTASGDAEAASGAGGARHAVYDTPAPETPEILERIPFRLFGKNLWADVIREDDLSPTGLRQINEISPDNSVSYAYAPWPPYHAVSTIIDGINREFRIQILGADYSPISPTTVVSFSNGTPIQATIFTKTPKVVFQICEKGCTFVNYIADLETGEVTRWFEGDVRFDAGSLNPEETHLFYIDHHEEERIGIFKHKIGEDKGDRLFQIDLTDRLSCACEQIVYGPEISDKWVFADAPKTNLFSQIKFITPSMERASFFPVRKGEFFREFNFRGGHLFFLSNYPGFSYLFKASLDDIDRKDPHPIEHLFYGNTVIEYTASADGNSVAVLVKNGAEFEWRFGDISKNSLFPISASHQNIQDVINTRGDLALVRYGDPRYPTSVVEMNYRTGEILRTLDTPFIPQGIYYPQMHSFEIPSLAEDKRPVHFNISIPPLFAEGAPRQFPVYLSLPGGPVSDMTHAKEQDMCLRTAQLANQGIGALTINYRAKIGMGKDSIASMMDEDGNYNLNHVWDVVTVLRALQDTGRISRFVIAGASFDGYTALAIAGSEKPYFKEGLNIGGVFLISGAFFKDMDGERSTVEFGKTLCDVPIVGFHGVHDRACEFEEEFLPLAKMLHHFRHPNVAMLPFSEGEHSLSSDSLFNEFDTLYKDKVITAMARGDADPFAGFKTSDLYHRIHEAYRAYSEASESPTA